ncbi:MAG: NAD-dependent epimerase/dehydratase family protein [Calditrichaeota bacterium]|nr:MAG: NAD-dependent epimerase/dehydratase family protein [Calditrichota bacterium]
MLKRVVITGASGTVGRELSRLLESAGTEVIGWDRRRVPVNNYAAMEDFLEETRPQVLFHLATASRPTGLPNEDWLVNFEWASELAWITRHQGIRFVFTSSVLVFSSRARGPFTLESEPDAMEGYGFQKRMAEQRVMYQNPEAVVVRLGWQIGRFPGSNNMVDFLHRQMEREGRIEASQKWLPACSFLEDTVQVLAGMWKYPAGLYMVDSNRGWNFYQIAQALNHRFGQPWKVVPGNSLDQDQRMIDPRVEIPPLSEKLSQLG